MAPVVNLRVLSCSTSLEVSSAEAIVVNEHLEAVDVLLENARDRLAQVAAVVARGNARR